MKRSNRILGLDASSKPSLVGTREKENKGTISEQLEPFQSNDATTSERG